MKTQQILHVCLTATLGLAALLFNAAEAGVVLLDNTNAATASLAAKNGLTTRPNRYFAYSFSTTANYTLETLTIGAFSADSTPDARTGTISLYSSSGGLPTGTPLAQTSAAITALGTPQYFSFSLPSSFAITAGNTYALSFAVDGLTSDNNFRWSETDTEAIPTGSNGVSFVPSLNAGASSRYAAENNDSTWAASLGGNRPTMYLQAAAVPEPSTCMLTGIAIAGGVGYHRLRRRAC
jgi:hypothetical protein